MFTYPGGRFLRAPAVQVGEDLVVEEVADGVFGISTSEHIGYYGLGWGGLRYLGREYVPPETTEADEQRAREMGDTFWLTGTDGRWYGFGSYVHYEPACPPYPGGKGFVVAGDTGELVICGWSFLAPVLASLDGSYEGVAAPMLPAETAVGGAEDCDRVLDLRELSEGASAAAGEAM